MSQSRRCKHESRSIPLCSSSVPAAFIIPMSILCGVSRGLTRIMTRNPVTWSVPTVCTSANVFASRSAQSGTKTSGRQAEASSSSSEVRPLSHYSSTCTAVARCCRLNSHSSASLCSAAAAAQAVVPLSSLTITLHLPGSPLTSTVLMLAADYVLDLLVDLFS